jgi:hypothetical protein
MKRGDTTLLCPILLALFLVLIGARSAYAYIDPGTGSFMLQILIATLVGSAFAVKLFWKRIKHSVGNLVWRARRGKQDAE